MTRPASPCPFYGMPCQYVPMAHRTDKLEAENAKLRAAVQALLPFAEFQLARMREKRNPAPITKAITEARAALNSEKEEGNG